MGRLHPDAIPHLVYANSRGEILDYDQLSMAGASGLHCKAPRHTELIELPAGSELFVLPQRHPIGINPVTGQPELLITDPYNKNESVWAVAAFMAPAHTAIYTAAYRKNNEQATILPLFAYTAVGWSAGRFWVTAFRSDSDQRQDAHRFSQKKINKNTKKRLQSTPHNRLIQHLGRCCLTYGCPAARNYFLDRWEAPLPTSPICNASCIGCISLQPSGCCPATQERINFVPTPGEIGEIALPHLAKAPRPVVSFGQGCEGEPLLQAATIEKAIRLIRSKTDKGTINLNTNGSLPQAVERLARAGLDSIRISMNSARTEFHGRYYRPSGFNFADVVESIQCMKKQNRHVSLNYFILPGFTDAPEEFDAFCRLLETCKPDMIQLRNLNMDPEYYLKSIGHNAQQEALGIPNWLEQLHSRFPSLRFGYFNPSLR